MDEVQHRAAVAARVRQPRNPQESFRKGDRGILQIDGPDADLSLVFDQPEHVARRCGSLGVKTIVQQGDSDPIRFAVNKGFS